MFLCLCLLSITSCKTNIETTVQGWWTIDTIYYKRYDLRTCLLGNSLEFKINKQSILPVAEKNCEPVVTNSYDKLANIEITQSHNPKDTLPLRMKITTNNEVFAGMHKIVFYKDKPNRLLKMEIWSDSLYIVCRKGLFNFDKNIDLINELEKISWTTRPELLGK
jgi:hypothetical protein